MRVSRETEVTAPRLHGHWSQAGFNPGVEARGVVEHGARGVVAWLQFRDERWQGSGGRRDGDRQR